MRAFKDKLKSRKFLMALAGLLTGVAILISGNMTEGLITLLTSIISYVIAEGYIDGKSVQSIAESVIEVVEDEENDKLL